MIPSHSMLTASFKTTKFIFDVFHSKFPRSVFHKDKSCLLLFETLSSMSSYLYFYTPVEDGTYYGNTRGVRPGGQRPHSLSGAYLQDYASYGYEISWVDRSHQGGVQCTGIKTLACLIF